jgi:hypothetical protein
MVFFFVGQLEIQGTIVKQSFSIEPYGKMEKITSQKL